MSRNEYFQQYVREDGTFNKERIPLEIKLLICFRLLARGNVVDDIAELSDVKNTAIHVMFKTFVLNFSRVFKDSWIYMPIGDDLKRVMEVYSRLGFPGCVGSADCTHVKWTRCPFTLNGSCTGKEGFSTLAFHVIVSHDRMIRSVSPAMFGAHNDINICHLDPIMYNDDNGFLNSSRRRFVRYKNMVFDVIDENLQVTRIVGAYLITDGGYENLSIYINPSIARCDRAAVVWCEFLESVRKDVECTFGMLKQRFQYFQKGIFCRDEKIVQAAFECACILHNMLLVLDGYDIASWESNVQWDSVEMNPDCGI